MPPSDQSQETSDDRGGTVRRRLRKAFRHLGVELFVAVLIVVSVLMVLLQEGLAPGSPYRPWVHWANDVITVVFCVELLLRFYAERDRSQFFKKYWYDIIAVIPVFRAARFLRILRILRLMRFGMIAVRRFSRFSSVFRRIRDEYIILGVIAVTVVLMGGLSLRYAESEYTSVGSALWFAFKTVVAAEPVGTEPTSMLGQVVMVTLMVGGLTVFAVLTGTVSAIMIDVFRNLDFKPMELDDVRDHIVVCGWNQAGPLILEELLDDRDPGAPLVLVTEKEGLDELPVVKQHADQVFTVVGDYTKVDVLENIGVERASTALLLADDTEETRTAQDRDARTVLAAVMIERLNPEIHTTVQLLNRDNQQSLDAVDIEEVVVTDEFVGTVMATLTRARRVGRMLEELLTVKEGSQFYRRPVPDHLVGSTVLEAMEWLKREHDATLIGIDTCDPTLGEPVVVNPSRDFELESQHELFIAADEPITE